MSGSVYKVISLILGIVVVVLALVVFKQLPTVDCKNAEQRDNLRYELSRGLQTSAKYLNKVAMLDACLDPANSRKQKIHHLIKDVEIKSSSYSLLNKVFFWLSLGLAFCIVSFPVLGGIVPQDSIAAKVFSPTQLPAITLLAGLCFTFYSDYKGKQTSAENLIRYAYTSIDKEEVISRTIREGLASIDDGHDFSELLKTDKSK